MTHSQFLTFCVCSLAMLFLFATLYQHRAGRQAARHPAAGAARAARMSMTPSEKYTAAAYLVVFVGVLAYVLIIASKLQRLQRQVGELVEKLRERELEPPRTRWLSCSSGRRCSATGRRRSPTPRRATRASRPGACGSAGSRRPRSSPSRRRGSTAFPVVDLGRLAQPLRLARRRRLPDLGLPAALPAARPGSHAACRAALRRRARRRRHGRGRAVALLEPVPDRPRRLRARRLRRLHAGGGARGALPDRGTQAAAALARHPAAPAARRSSCSSG